MNYELYIKLTKLINDSAATPDEIRQAVAMLAAQDPVAIPELRAALFVARETYRFMTGGEELPMIEELDTQQFNPSQKTDGYKPINVPLPETDNDIPVVYVEPHPTEPDCYIVDRHTAKVILSFHMQEMPPTDFFEENPHMDGCNIDTAYGHAGGSFRVNFRSDGSCFLILRGGFDLDTFVPVKVEIKEG